MAFKLYYLILVLTLLLLSACQNAPEPAPEVTQLTFTYWGSEMEKAAIEGMVAQFEALRQAVQDAAPLMQGRWDR